MRPIKELTPRGNLFILGVIAAGIVFIPLSWWTRPLEVAQVPELIYLGAMTQLAALLPIRWRSGLQFVYTPSLVAAGLLAPGVGVAVLAWLFLYDRRVPGRDAPIWRLAFVRANTALSHGVPSLLSLVVINALPWHGPWQLSLRVVVYSCLLAISNYLLTAQLFGSINRTSLLQALRGNVGLGAITSLLLLGFSGAILFVLLATLAGYFLAPGLIGFLLAVRANMVYANEQLALREQTIKLAAQALDARDRYTESHSARVAEMAVRLGAELGLNDRDLDRLRMAGSLHDIGKIGIRDAILNKPGPLSPEEWEIMRTHPVIGAEMIAQHSALAPLAKMVRHHHERWNGTGYPDALTAEEIPLGARILAVADSFDTITGPRLYRPTSMGPTEAVAEITRQASVWYDPSVVQALRAIYGLPALRMTPLARQEPKVSTALSGLLSNDSYRRLLVGVFISSLGDPMTTVASLYLAYATTRSAFAPAAIYSVRALAALATGAGLSGLFDALPRRELLLCLELLRGAVLCAVPFAIGASPSSLRVWLVLPALAVLSAVGVLVQPARQAILPRLVAPADVPAAAGTMITTMQLAGVVGFPVAGALLYILHGPTPLFFVDAATFVAAGAIVFSLGALGGGAAGKRAWKGLQTAFQLPSARPHLVLAGLASFAIAISYPCLIQVAYHLEPRLGTQLYTYFEAVIGVGFVAASLVLPHTDRWRPTQLESIGLLLMGVFSLAIGFSNWVWLTALVLMLASIGNPIYGAGNQGALLGLGSDDDRAGLMTVRFTLSQTAVMLGSLAGGVLAATINAQHAYAFLGAMLVVVSLVYWIWQRLSYWSRTVLLEDARIPVGAK